ncbi:hypothetical protein, partial [Paraburkholderia sp. UYCP14C]|uniref:hypothetical protein n=1 Tax=Paraburkholderia sp. UYCP14C TaxID=2511130 RepID=UPI001B7D6A33
VETRFSRIPNGEPPPSTFNYAWDIAIHKETIGDSARIVSQKTDIIVAPFATDFFHIMKKIPAALPKPSGLLPLAPR